MSAELAKYHWKWATNALSAAIRDAIHHDPRNAVSREPLAKLLGCGSAQSSDSQGEHPIVLDFDCVFWS